MGFGTFASMFRQNYEVYPRHVLCVLGSGLDFDVVEKVVAEVGGPGFSVDLERFQQAHDPRMPRSFDASLANVSFTESDWGAVETHDSVVYVLSPPMRQNNAFDLHRRVMVGHGDGVFEEVWDRTFDVSRRMLAVTAALLRSGATAAKGESSGLAHGRERWLTLADRAAEARDREMLAVILFHAWVKRPLLDGSLLKSCGMHLLGAPDVQIDIGSPAGKPLPATLVGEVVDLIDEVALYLLTERRAREMSDGEGYRSTPDGPRWIMERHPCLGYEEDSFFFNPYGYWRFTPDEPSTSTPAEP